MAASDSTALEHKPLADMFEKNHFTNIHLITGFEEFSDEFEFLILKSGRMINSTKSWNPFIFALVYDHDELLKYFESKINFINIKKCLYVENIFEIEN